MGKKSKFAMAMAGIGLCVGSAFMLGGCNWDKNKTTNEQIYAIYETAVDNGYTGTYQEWLDSIKGAKGDHGKDGSVVTIGEDGYWYIDGVKTEVLALGKNGADGQTPTISISADGYWVINGTKIDAKAKGDKGDSGQNGIDGREIEFNKSATHIQWRYKTVDNSDTWKDLIALSELKGETGEKGLDGMITYDEYRQAKPNYRKTKAEFINEMLMGKLAPIASEDTIGDVNGDGKVSYLDREVLARIRSNDDLEYIDAEYYARADVDLNGVVDDRDTFILYLLTQKYFAFPGEYPDRTLLPIRYQYGDINMDGVVDNNDLTLLSNMTEEEYNASGWGGGPNFTRFILSNLGYRYSQEQSKYVLEHYLNGDIKSLDQKIHFVEVDYNGYETSLPTQYVYKDHEMFNLKLSDRTGYMFKGWNVDGAKYVIGNSFVIYHKDSVDIKVTAMWEDTRANVSKNLEFTKNADNTYTLTGIGTNTDENLVIPAYYDGMLVTGIKLYATNEEKTTSIKQIVVPFGVNNIDIRCGFASLETIIVDENNKIYDSRDNCNAIIETATNTLVFGCRGTVIPESVTKIYNYAFYGSNIETLTISENITDYGTLYLYTMSNLKTLIINNNNIKVYRAMLHFASSIETIVCNNVDFWTAPLDGVEFKDTFEGLRCNNLKNLYIPQGITPVDGLLNGFTKQATSDRAGYELWTKNA